MALTLGYINLNKIGRLVKNGPLRELKVGTLPVCESCLEGKMTKRPFSAKGNQAKEPLLKITFRRLQSIECISKRLLRILCHIYC